MDTNTYLIETFYGENFDASIFTNGGTYHKVVVENIDDGSREIRKFFSRAKAYRFAEGATK